MDIHIHGKPAYLIYSPREWALRGRFQGHGSWVSDGHRNLVNSVHVVRGPLKEFEPKLRQILTVVGRRTD